jgi:hypothetical protein
MPHSKGIRLNLMENIEKLNKKKQQISNRKSIETRGYLIWTTGRNPRDLPFVLGRRDIKFKYISNQTHFKYIAFGCEINDTHTLTRPLLKKLFYIVLNNFAIHIQFGVQKNAVVKKNWRHVYLYTSYKT